MWKKLFFSSAFLVGVAFSSPVLHIQHWKTKKGLTVFFNRQTNIPMLNINMVFDAGSVRDGVLPGVANLTSTMMGEDAVDMSSGDIARAFADVGAHFTTSVSKDNAQVGLQTLTNKKYLLPALHDFTYVISRPAFLNKTLSRIKSQIVTRIHVESQSPSVVAKQALFKTLYKDLPYSHPITGSINQLNLLSQKNVMTFYQSHYVDNNADLILVGDITSKQAHHIAEAISIALPEGHQFKPISSSTLQKKISNSAVSLNVKQTTVMLAGLGVNYQSPDYYSLFIGNYILGGSSLSSILNQQLREKRGLVYGVQSVFSRMKYTGPFYIWFQTRANQTNNAIKITLKTLTDFLKRGVNNKRFIEAKQSIIGAFPLALASNSSISNMLTNIAFYHLPLNYLDNFRKHIDAVTQQQMLSAMNKHIHVKRLVTIEVGPHGKS